MYTICYINLLYLYYSPLNLNLNFLAFILFLNLDFLTFVFCLFLYFNFLTLNFLLFLYLDFFLFVFCTSFILVVFSYSSSKTLIAPYVIISVKAIFFPVSKVFSIILFMTKPLYIINLQNYFSFLFIVLFLLF